MIINFINKYWWALFAAFAVAACIISLSVRDRASREIGVLTERDRVSTEVIKNVRNATEARDQVRNDIDGARYNQCMRTARTPANCERFLPARQADQR